MKRSLFFFTLALVLPLIFGFVLYPVLKYMWGHNPRYQIRAIVQKKTSPDSLKCSFLAEKLDLTKEKINLYHFDLKGAKRKLYESHVIKEVTLKKIKPHTLFIDYTLRKPIAYVADRANTAIDEEGFLFPFAPFYTPKHLPEIFFGGYFSSEVWGSKMDEKKMGIVKEILTLFPCHSISWIDVSHMETTKLGQKEIVVEYKSCLLRLSPNRYVREIAHFFLLEDHMNESIGSCTIDLRLPNVAFLHRDKNDIR